MCEANEYSNMGIGPVADHLERTAAVLEVIVPMIEDLVSALPELVAENDSGWSSEIDERLLARELGIDRAYRALRRIARVTTDPFDALLRASAEQPPSQRSTAT